MIIQNHPTGGAAVLLYDMHGEYSGGLSALGNYEDGEFLRCSVAWDFSLINDVAATAEPTQSWDQVDAAVCDAFRRLFPGLEDRLEVLVGTGSLWHLYGGSPKGLERAFNHLLEVTNDEPSGDDDTFDYWPSAMRMLRAFAVDLDEMMGGDHLSRYRSLLDNARWPLDELGLEEPGDGAQ